MNKIVQFISRILPTSPSDPQADRNLVIVRTGITGILANTLLALIKAFTGLATRSIAITLDAVNNLTDAGSSLITIIGTLLAAKKPDKKHPYGHGRMEYLSAMLLGALIFSAGISSLIESIRKILWPEVPEYSVLSLVIVAVCILVKIVLGRHVTATGKQVNSETLINSGKDALMDALISASTFTAAVIFLSSGLALEAWLGALISVLIIKTGVEMEYSTISEILGQRVSPDIVRAVRRTVESFPEVYGVYDMMLHDYGPNRITGSLHVEVIDTMPAYEISDLIRRISVKVYQDHHVLLSAIGIYSKNSQNAFAGELRKEITDIAMKHEHVLQVHGFYLKNNVIQFDVIVDFDTTDPEGLCREITSEVEALHPGLTAQAFWDADYNFSE